MRDPWKRASNPDMSQEPAPQRRLALEITFRGVEPLDDVVLYVRECGARIESVLQGSGRCSVTAEALPRSDDRPRFGTRVHVVSTEHCVEVECEDGDLYVALWRAFDVAMRRVTRTQSGVHVRPTLIEATEVEAALAAAGGES